MQRTRLPLLLCLIALAAVLGACTENPASPIGNGELLDVTIDGTPLSFDPLGTYDDADGDASISGVLAGTPSRALSIFFIYDIVNGKFPATLKDPVVSMSFVQVATGDTLRYSSIGQSNTTMTLTASNGSIVDGTFSGTLVNVEDATKKIEVTNGKFSAKVR